MALNMSWNVLLHIISLWIQILKSILCSFIISNCCLSLFILRIIVPELKVKFVYFHVRVQYEVTD